MQLLATDVRQLVECLVWRHVGCRGMQTLNAAAQWCALLSAALDVSVRAFCDSRKRLSDDSNDAGSTAVTPTQGAAASERSTVHLCLSASRYGPCIHRTYCGWLSDCDCDWIILQGTALSQWLAGPDNLLHTGYQGSLGKSIGRNVNPAI